MKGAEATGRERGRAGETEGSGEGSKPRSRVWGAEKWGDLETEAWGTGMSLRIPVVCRVCSYRGDLRRCALRGRC